MAFESRVLCPILRATCPAYRPCRPWLVVVSWSLAFVPCVTWLASVGWMGRPVGRLCYCRRWTGSLGRRVRCRLRVLRPGSVRFSQHSQVIRGRAQIRDRPDARRTPPTLRLQGVQTPELEPQRRGVLQCAQQRIVGGRGVGSSGRRGCPSFAVDRCDQSPRTRATMSRMMNRRRARVSAVRAASRFHGASSRCCCWLARASTGLALCSAATATTTRRRARAPPPCWQRRAWRRQAPIRRRLQEPPLNFLEAPPPKLMTTTRRPRHLHLRLRRPRPRRARLRLHCPRRPRLRHRRRLLP